MPPRLHVALEIRRDFDDEGKFAPVHQRIGIVRVDGFWGLEKRGLQRIADTEGQHGLVMVDYGDGGVFHIGGHPRHIVHRHGENIGNQDNQHGVGKHTAEFFAREIVDIFEHLHDGKLHSFRVQAAFHRFKRQKAACTLFFLLFQQQARYKRRADGE